MLVMLLFIGNNIMAADYVVKTGEFNEVRIRNAIPIVIVETNDSTGTATFSTDNETTVQSIVFELKDGKLTVSLDPRTYNRNNPIPIVTLRTATIDKATNEGDSLMIVQCGKPKESFSLKQIGNGSSVLMNIEAREVKVALSLGAGRINVVGLCAKAKLDNTGQGLIQAATLKTKEAVCYIMGTGNIDCYASESLSVKGMGSGTVFYGGHPSVVKNHGLGIKLSDCQDCQ